MHFLKLCAIFTQITVPPNIRIMKIYFLPAFFILLLDLFSSHVSGQQGPYSQYLDHPWVDSVLAELNMEERMAQTLWINTGSHKDLSHYVKLDQLVREYGIGGLIFKTGADTRQTELIRHYHIVSKHPLAIASEGDWGGEFPGQPALHAISSDSLLHQLGCRIGQHFRGHGDDGLRRAPLLQR